MTVTNKEVRSDALGNGSSTSFAYDFYIQTDSQMAVYFDNVKQLSGFTVNGAGNPLGGTVVFSVAPALNVLVTLIREAAETQETDYVPYDAFPAETHEAALDKLTLLVQQLVERNLRNLGYDISGGPTDATLPAPEPNKAIGYDALGNLTNVSVGVGGTPVVNPLQEDLLSGGNDFVVTDGVPDIKGRLTDTANGIDVVSSEFTLNGEDLVTDAPNDGAQYVRESKLWQVVDVPPATTVSDVAPGTPTQGQFWFRSDIGRLYMYYVDVDGAQWVEVGPAPGAAALGTPVGGIIPYAGAAEPSGWVLCDGSSYDGTDQTYAPLFAVIGTTYGGSGNSFQVPDMRGRLPAGKDDMGGAPANLLTNITTNGIVGNVLGAKGGSQSHTLSVPEMPAHFHEYGTQLVGGLVGGGTGFLIGSAGTLLDTTAVGGNTTHNNVQPSIITNYIIKL